MSEVQFPYKTIMPNAEYHSHPAIGSSLLKKVLRSPAHYLSAKENPQESTPAMEFGTHVHEAILEPQKFKDSVAVMPNFAGAGSVAKRDDWKASNRDKRIISQEDLDKVRQIDAAVKRHKIASRLLDQGKPEESYFAILDGQVCKARPDYLRDGHIIVDIKTTGDASIREFSKAIANFDYHLSAAFYLDVVSATLGETYDEFLIIAVEKTPPYAVAVYLLDQGTIDAGGFLYKKALSTLLECKQTNNYPSYPESIQPIALPSWAFPSEY